MTSSHPILGEKTLEHREVKQLSQHHIVGELQNHGSFISRGLLIQVISPSKGLSPKSE